jgi:hypothetical protein
MLCNDALCSDDWEFDHLNKYIWVLVFHKSLKLEICKVNIFCKGGFTTPSHAYEENAFLKGLILCEEVESIGKINALNIYSKGIFDVLIERWKCFIDAIFIV